MDIFSNPALIQAALAEQQKANDLAISNSPILGQVGYNARQSAGNAMNAVGNLMGMPKQVDPRVQQAQQAQAAIKGIDMTNPKGMREAAQKLNALGMTNEAVTLAQKAYETERANLNAAATYNNSTKVPDNRPTSIKEYEYHQKLKEKDPVAAKAYKEMMGKKGINVEVNTGDHHPLGKTQTGNTEGKVIDSEDQIARIEDLNSIFKSDFLEIPNKIGFKWNELQDKFGVDLDPESEEALYEYADFRAQAYDNLNRYIKFITGAQMSEAEAKRLRRAIPDPGDGIFDGDSPTQFKAKLARQEKMLNASNLRYKTLLKLGIDVSQIESMSKDGSIEKYKLNDFANAYEAIKKGAPEEEVMKRLEEGYAI